MTSLPLDPKLIVTTDTLPGYEIVACLGVAEGYALLPVMAFTAEGRKTRFHELLSPATLDMMENAKAHDAQAIVGMRYVPLNEGGMLVYGTTVTIRPVESPIRVWGPSIRQ